jgi:hypothetical protein
MHFRQGGVHLGEMLNRKLANWPNDFRQLTPAGLGLRPTSVGHVKLVATGMVNSQSLYRLQSAEGITPLHAPMCQFRTWTCQAEYGQYEEIAKHSRSRI